MMKKFFVILLLSLLFFVSDVSAKTEAPVDITLMGITEISDSLEKGYFTSEQLVQMYLERIEEYDYLFNSINQLNNNAINDAKRLDKERKEGKVRSKLHGVPILVKCNIDVYGVPTTAGTKSLNDNFPNQNAFVVQRLIDAGAIVLGSTNMSELAFSASNSYSLYGNVKNVFNVEYTPYGSSGGAAVSVSAGFAAASLGTDTNSSVRIPAAGAGLVGLRPTLGLVSRSGVIPYDIERDTVGILSKNVLDSALILSIIAGKDDKDNYTNKSFEKVYDLSNSSLDGKVIGVATQFVTGNNNSTGIVGLTDEDIKNMTLQSIKKLEDAGAKIVYLDNFAKYKYYSISYSTYAGITMCDNFNEYIKGTSGSIRGFEELNKSKGHVQRLSGYVEGCGHNYKDKSVRDEKKNVYKEYVASFFQDYDLDVIVYPTLKNKVFKIGEGSNSSPGSVIGGVIGYPSITVPMGFLDDGFSYGIEILSQEYNEEVLFNVAREFEIINNNENILSSLTPSLYEIGDNTELLVQKYDELYNNKTGDNGGWISSVKDFFENYNTIDNKDERARELLDVLSRKGDSKSRTFQIILILIVILFVLRIIKVQVKRHLRKLRRKKRRRLQRKR